MSDDIELLIALKKKADASGSRFNYRLEKHHKKQDIALFDREAEEGTDTQRQKQIQNSLQIMDTQQLLSRLRVIVSSSLAVRKSGIKTKKTVTDIRLLNSPELPLKTIRRKILRKKLEKPLKLKGKIPEKGLKKSIKGLYNLISAFSKEYINGIDATKLKYFSQTKVPQKLAKILQKQNPHHKIFSSPNSNFAQKSFKYKPQTHSEENSAERET